MSSLFVINPENIDHMISTLHEIESLGIDPAKTIIIKQVVNTIENGLKNSMLENISFGSSSEENGVTKRDQYTPEVLQNLLMKKNEFRAKINTGFIVIEYPENATMEKHVGIDTFLDIDSLYEYLKINGVKEVNNFASWEASVSNISQDQIRDGIQKINEISSNCMFTSQYNFFEIRKEKAVEYLTYLIKNKGKIQEEEKKKFDGYFTKRTIIPRKSTFFVINNESIEIVIDSSVPEISSPRTNQRFLYLYEVIKRWIETFKNRWIEIFPSPKANYFEYSISRKVGWGLRPVVSFGEKRLKKDMNFIRDKKWFNFTNKELSDMEKINFLCVFLSYYGFDVKPSQLVGTPQKIKNIMHLMEYVNPTRIEAYSTLEIPEPKSAKNRPKLSPPAPRSQASNPYQKLIMIRRVKGGREETFGSVEPEQKKIPKFFDEVLE